MVIKKLQCNVHLALVFLLYHAVIFTFLKAFFVYELLFCYNKNRLKIFHTESLENWKQGFKTKKEMKSWSVFSKKNIMQKTVSSMDMVKPCFGKDDSYAVTLVIKPGVWGGF